MRPILAMWKSGAVFDPATLPLSMWCRTNFGGDPWASTASAGASGGRSLIDGTSPTTGTAINGRTPADYNGTTQFQTSGTNVSGLVTSTAGSFVVLYNADTAAAAAANGYQDACFMSMVFRGDLSFGVNSTGVRAHMTDLSAASLDVTKAASVASWHLGHMRWNSTTLEVGVDGSWAAGVAITGGGADSGNYATTNFQVGCDYVASVFFDGRIAEWMSSATRLSDTDVNNIKSYCNSRYGLAL